MWPLAWLPGSEVKMRDATRRNYFAEFINECKWSWNGFDILVAHIYYSLHCSVNALERSDSESDQVLL
jgi:hypothetical protein